MAHSVANRVRETSTTTGTGTYTLAGAVSGFQSFSVVGNGNTCFYAAVMGTGWEIGFGTWATGGTLARTGIIASSNAGAAVNWGAGTKDIFITNPAERLVLGAGGTAAGTAPLKLTTQASPLTSPEQGAFELVGNRLHFTKLAVRRTVAHAQSIRTADLTIANDVTETEIFSTAQGAGYLEVGMQIEASIRGLLTSQSAAGANTLTVKVKYGGTTHATFVIPEAARSALPFEIEVVATCRSVGGTGSMQIFASCKVDTETNAADQTALATIDTTTAQNLSVTAQWSDASASNSCVIKHARALCIDNPS